MEPLTTSLSVPLPTLVSLGFYCITGIYALFSIILYYHWNEYSTDAKVTFVTLTLFFVTTIPLILSLGLITLAI